MYFHEGAHGSWTGDLIFFNTYNYSFIVIDSVIYLVRRWYKYQDWLDGNYPPRNYNRYVYLNPYSHHICLFDRGGVTLISNYIFINN